MSTTRARAAVLLSAPMLLAGVLATPALAKKRKELLGLLDALADGPQHGPAPEPDLATAAAPIERA